MSGDSGAGRSSSVEMSFGEVNESVRAYKVGTHQHIPEIESALATLSDSEVRVTFVPHLLPTTRGIYSTIIAQPTKALTDETIAAAYAKYYGRAPFVRILGTGVPEIRNVNLTNFIDIGWKLYLENGQIILLAAIDNLV